MKVTLLTHTPEPEKVVAAAAKLCYSQSADVDTLMKVSEQTDGLGARKSRRTRQLYICH